MNVVNKLNLVELTEELIKDLKSQNNDCSDIDLEA